MNTRPNRLSARVEPALSASRVDAQWARIAERLPEPKRNVRALGWAGVALAACAALALVYTRWPESTASVWAGSVVASDDAPVDFTLAEGTHIELDPRSQVQLLSSSPTSVQLALSGGSAHFNVAKKRSRRFSVRSGPVEVLVTGTQFRVTRAASAMGDRVSVAVEEGTVEVHREGQERVSLHAGDHWSTFVERKVPARADVNAPTPSHEAEQAENVVDEERAEPLDEPNDEPLVQRESHRRKHAHNEQPSEAEMLFERANVARRAGLLREAADLFDELVETHARDRHAALAAFELGRMRMDSFGDMKGAVSALERALSLDARRAFAEDALARLTLAYEALGDTKACNKARERYLARYPEGVHAQYLLGRCPNP
jgi:tetratricopeptide (TPR) repeat protein